MFVCTRARPLPALLHQGFHLQHRAPRPWPPQSRTPLGLGTAPWGHPGPVLPAAVRLPSVNWALRALEGSPGERVPLTERNPEQATGYRSTQRQSHCGYF